MKNELNLATSAIPNRLIVRDFTRVFRVCQVKPTVSVAPSVRPARRKASHQTRSSPPLATGGARMLLFASSELSCMQTE